MCTSMEVRSLNPRLQPLNPEWTESYTLTPNYLTREPHILKI